MSDAILAQFAAKLQAAGLVVEHIEADGLLHRCGTIDKPHSKNGSYRAHLDAPPTVWWMDWTTGDSDTFCVTPEKQLAPAEKKP